MLDEQQLLSKIQKEDDEASFKTLFNFYWDILFSNALKKTKSQDLAQDLSQETFINFWKYRKNIKGVKNLKAYLLTMQKYQFLKGIDQEKIVFDSLDSAIPSDSFSDNSDGFKIMEFNELFTFLMDRVEELPPKSKQIYIQHRFENKTVKELSETFSISESTVRNHLSQANNKIQFELENNLLTITLLSLILS